MRAPLVLLVTLAGLLTSIPMGPPIRRSLDDLRSNAVELLNESDGVFKVEWLVAVDRPTHRIVHIHDWHWVPFESLSADLRDQDSSLTDDEIREIYDGTVASTAIVHETQKRGNLPQMVNAARQSLFTVTADTSQACSIVRELGDLLKPGCLPPEIVEPLLKIRKSPRGFFRIKACPAVGQYYGFCLSRPTVSLISWPQPGHSKSSDRIKQLIKRPNVPL